MSTFQLPNARVVVTGGTGFLGKHVVKLLKQRKTKDIFVPSHQEYDLRLPEACRKAVAGADAVVHLAANVGGIGYNQAHPAELFYDNLLMGVHTLEESRLQGVKKFVAVGTICAYPKFTPVPFEEEKLWDGYPEETNAPYGLAKKMLLVQGQASRQQYGFNVIYLLPTNMYGPGDKFEPKVSHVIPALIDRIVKAKRAHAKTVTIWGSGRATREFLYVEDAARGIVDALEKYDGNEPVNLGSQSEISIRELAELIVEIVGFDGELLWDTSKPDGQPRRKVRAARAKEYFGFEAKTNFKVGLKRTIDWYIQQNKI